MKTSSFVTILAALMMILVLTGGCATSGPEYERSGFHRFVAAISDDNPVRRGIIENSRPYPVNIYIDGKLEGSVSQRFYGYFSVTAKEKHTLTVKDSYGRTIRPDETFTVPNAPLGIGYPVPPRRIKIIDTGWVIRI
jgi:hypothetical protein